MRELSLSLLMRVNEEGAFLKDELSMQLMRYQYLEKKERAFLTRLTEGCIERQIELDYVISQFSRTKLSKMKPFIRNLLRMGTYQILYMKQVPDSAACNEAVKLAKKHKFVNLAGFVNGVLRNISRNKTSRTYPEKKEEALSVKYSIPLWLVKLWISQYGGEVTEKMLSGIYEERKLCLRICNGRSFHEVAEELSKEGLVAEPGRYLSDACYVSGYDQIQAIPGFTEGDFYVQDESSMLSVKAAASIYLGQKAVWRKAGETEEESIRILDLCASPGGKSLYMAELFREKNVFISARDVSEAKVAKITENIERLGLQGIEAKLWDGRVLEEASANRQDIVIADLPCSGLGVIRKKQDIKYRMSPEQIKELVQLQRELLDTAAHYPKKGGVLLYSTCTINQAENEENARYFLKCHPEYQMASIREYLPEELHSYVIEEGMLQLYPGIHGTDGFFMAGFLRKE